MTSIVLDASAAIELLTRSTIGADLESKIPRASTWWAPDGLFDVEVHGVLRRWDLNGVLDPASVAGARLRLHHLRLRRAPVRMLLDRAWSLRKAITFADACYVSLAESVGCPLVTADQRLVNAPGLPVDIIHPDR